jgi:DNA-binding NarL/FixJ family response regulator
VHALVVEDNVLLRDGLARLLGAHDIEVSTVDSAVGLEARLNGVDVVVMDVRLPPTYTTEGLQAAIAARRQRPGLPVLVLSQHVEQLYARELLATGDGAVGYLLKDRVVEAGDFVAAVRRVAAGGTVLDPSVVSRLLSRGGPGAALERLSTREREVMNLMAQGRSNAAIAAALVVTDKAVVKHIGSIFTKLDLPPAPDDNRRVLAVLAFLDAG